MAQSALTVTPENPTPPTNLSYVGATPPLDPAQAAVDDGIALAVPNSGNLGAANGNTLNEPSGSRVVFAAKTAAAGSGTSVDAEGRGTETLFTQTYNPAVYAPIVLTMDGCGPAATPASILAGPNASHASSLSPATNPALASIAPTTAVSGATGNDTITCTGTNFTKQSVVYRDGIAMPTTYVSATSITASVRKRATAGASTITVITGGVVTTAGQTLTYS